MSEPATTSAVARPPQLVRAAAAAGRVQPLYPATRLIKGGVVEAQAIRAEAVRLREEALAEAAAIRKAAQDEADAVRQAAYENGAQDAAAQCSAMLGKLDQEIDNFRNRFAIDVQRVAFRFAKAILEVEFQARPDRMVQLVAKVMKPARLYHWIKIHLHPSDLAFVKAAEAQLAKQLPLAKEIQFCSDPDMQQHGVRIETEMGNYDGTLDTQIRRLQDHLLPGVAPLEDTGPAQGTAP